MNDEVPVRVVCDSFEVDSSFGILRSCLRTMVLDFDALTWLKPLDLRRRCIGGTSCGGDNLWRSLLQTLLVTVGCGGVLGLLPGLARFYPGSPRRGSADPGLYYAAPLGLLWRGVVGWEMALSVLRHRILVNCKAGAEGATVEKVVSKVLGGGEGLAI